MSDNTAKQIWEEYRKRELEKVLPMLEKLGYSIESYQPHMQGERYLMQAVTTTAGRKLILLGKRKSDGERVVIKATSDPSGIKEIEHERESRALLKKIKFAYQVFFSPKEILFTKQNGVAISIQVFLDQECIFLKRSIEEQFSLILESFKAQEGAHATTFGHIRLIKSAFGSQNAKGYIKTFKTFRENITACLPDNDVSELLVKGENFLKKNKRTIEQYSGFLTHIDFVPHNFRVVDGNIYLLDHSSMRFGNKYEGWARFINFMALHNPKLADVLVQYVKANRTQEESLSLKLMRVYRLGEIIWYYTNTLQKSSSNLLTLNKKRVEFWRSVLEAVLNNTHISTDILEKYKNDRDSLRSEDEKKRQIGLH